MSRVLLASLAAVVLVAGLPQAAVAADKPPVTWDNMVQVPSKKLDAVFLTPGADFRGYTKVMFDPTEVAFEKNFRRNYNVDAVSLSRQLSTNDMKRIEKDVREGFEKEFRQVYEKAGYQIVTEPAEDVLRIRTGVADLYANAPDTMSPGRSYTFSEDVGRATLILEVRDSVSGALLGRAVDKRQISDIGFYMRDRVSNRSDFGNLFESWAKAAVAGLDELKRLSPIDPATIPKSSKKK